MLDLVPGEGMNSICGIIVHICGSEKYWVSDVVMGEPSGREREKEFVTKGLSTRELSTLLDESFHCLEGVFRRLSVEALAETRISPRDGKEVTVGWSILHALEHTGLHAGQIEITKDLFEMIEG